MVVENNPLALMSVAAYVDLNPVRAGLSKDPLDYVWSGYGLACGGNRGARKGLDLLVRCARGHLPREAVNLRIKQLKVGSSREEVGETMRDEHQRRAAPRDWDEVQKAYRVWLYHTGKDRSGDPRYAKREKMRNRKGFDPVEVVAEFERQGELPPARIQTLHRRMRSFSRGVGIGSPGFPERLMRDFRGCFGDKRKKAGRRIPGLSPILQSLRQAD